MKRKFFTPIILSITAALLLSGCGAQTQSTTEKQSTKVADITDQYYEATDVSKNPVTNRDDTFIATISEPGGVFIPYLYDNGWDGNAIDPIFASLVSVDDISRTYDFFKSCFENRKTNTRGNNGT